MMSGIVTVLVDRVDEGLRVNYFSSDGLTPEEVQGALQGVLRDMQRKLLEAEVERRVAAQREGEDAAG